MANPYTIGPFDNKGQRWRNQQIVERWKNKGSIAIGRVFALADMARNDVWPDGTFGDDECALWSEFRSLVNQKPAAS